MEHDYEFRTLASYSWADAMNLNSKGFEHSIGHVFLFHSIN